MAIFDYKDYDSQSAAELMTTSQALAVYTNSAAMMYFPAAAALNAIGSISGDYFANPVHVGPPAGWRELTPGELHLPDSSKDPSGYYTFASPLTGNSTIPGTGPQAKIFGQFDAEGKVTRVSIAWAGTNDPIDVADYFQLNTGEIAPNMQPLLEALKNYSVEHGLSAKDVIITGYSLGAGMTNIMAKYRETLAEGFFKDSNYIAHDSPILYDNADVIKNMGYENDVVYRILGNEPTLAESIAAGDPFLSNPDKMFASSADNIVLFNDTYASPLWGALPFSILNMPFGWSAHIDGVSTDALKRIAQSPFYQYTAADSTIIVDNLTALTRWNTWVEDKKSPTSDHYGTPAFIIGNEHDNLLKGGAGGDYIDAGGGNDKIKPGEGADRIDGGSGTDTLILNGSAADWDIYRLASGDMMFEAHDHSGLKQASHIEQVSFEGTALSTLHPYTIGENALIDQRFPVLQHLNDNIAYKHATEGTAGDDHLSGSAVFGGAGNDILNAVASGSLLHGGEGNDILLGGSGDDRLYGAEGKDRLYGGAGNNELFGGVGNDVFVVDAHCTGNTVIKDFNRYAGDHDQIVFGKDLFADSAAALAASRQMGDDVLIYSGSVSLVIKNTTVEQLEAGGAVAVM